MHEFELLGEGDSPQLHVTGSTFAGLLTGALQGLAKFLKSELVLPEAPVEQPFSLTANDAPTMILNFLNASILQPATHGAGEVYDGVRFTLVTPTKAEGAFLGKKIKRVNKATRAQVKQITIPTGIAAQNEQGVWETTIALH